MDGEGSGFTVTFAVFESLQPLVFVSTTFIVPVVVHCAVIAFVPAPLWIVPPSIDHV